MSFTGKATYSAGSTLPEMAEDVSDLIAINSPHETPLLDALGDPAHTAHATVHEWLEDSLLPNFDTVTDDDFSSPTADTVIEVANPGYFRVGDQVRPEGGSEIMLVSAIDTGGSTITVVRGYGSSTAFTLTTGTVLHILGNAALEGDSADNARFTSRTRKTNYSQIFSATVEVSGSELAVKQLGVADELDYQKAQRTRELLRDLENCVINGRAPASNPQGSASVRRTMKGLLSFITTNRFTPGSGGFPSGSALTETQLNEALRQVWKTSSGHIDLIVVGGQEKRSINAFVGSNRRYSAQGETFVKNIATYESDFGVCRIVLSRYVPKGHVLLLDSSRVEVMPLAGRSFHYKPLARTGDSDRGQLLGEYTLELRNESAHAVISGFTQ